MGAIHVTVNLSWPEATREYEELFLVGTRATDSMAPSSKMLELGFKPVGKMDYELANGEKVTYFYNCLNSLYGRCYSRKSNFRSRQL